MKILLSFESGETDWKSVVAFLAFIIAVSFTITFLIKRRLKNYHNSNIFPAKIETKIVATFSNDFTVEDRRGWQNSTINKELKLIQEKESAMDFFVKVNVRLEDNEDSTWHNHVDANIGDRVEFQIEYWNISNQKQENIAIRDVLPPNLVYVSDSTQIMNSSHSKGTRINENAVVEEGIRIGSYNVNANTFVKITAEVVDEDLFEGRNILVNWGQAGFMKKTLQDYAIVAVIKIT